MQMITKNEVIKGLQQSPTALLSKRSATSESFDGFLQRRMQGDNGNLNRSVNEDRRQTVIKTDTGQTEVAAVNQSESKTAEYQLKPVRNQASEKEEKVASSDKNPTEVEGALPEDWQTLPAEELLMVLLHALGIKETMDTEDLAKVTLPTNIEDENNILAKSLLDLVRELQELLNAEDISNDKNEKGVHEVLNQFRQLLATEEATQLVSSSADKESLTLTEKLKTEPLTESKQETGSLERASSELTNQTSKVEVDLRQTMDNSSQREGNHQSKEQQQQSSSNDFSKLQNETMVQMAPGQVEQWLNQSSFIQHIDHQKEQLQQDVTQQLMQKIQITHGKSESQVTMQLIPENLGKLTIQLINNPQNGLTAKIYAETQQARDLIETNFGQLRDALSGKGVNLSGIEVFVGQDPDSSHKQRAFQFQQARQRRRLSKEETLEGVRGLTSTAAQLESTNPYLSASGFDQLG